ncbi:MAG: RloB domain-containing protein [Bacteroidales bacterium]|nr:RloB domain-containing protein [Bacteroidales bacterium]
MKSKRQASKGKKINPHFWVFCEGETEEAYVRFLRSEYRLPVEIIPKVTGSSINERFINSYKKGKPIHEKDKDFLIYDADVPEVLEKLKKINKAILLVSNPTIELWFLLHYKNQTAALSGDDCVRELSNRNRNNYMKGIIDNPLKVKLKEKCSDACNRSKQLELLENPSTNLYVFIESLEEVKKEKMQ